MGMRRVSATVVAVLMAVCVPYPCDGAERDGNGRRRQLMGWDYPGKRTEVPDHKRKQLYSSGLPRHADTPVPRITGGKEAPIGLYPYMAALAFNSWFVECGGALIHPRVVLTAAHCVDPADIAYGALPVNLVHIGAWNLNVQGEDEESIPVQNILPHPLYNSSSLQYDVAVIILAWPSTITPVAMASGNENLDSIDGGSEADEWLVAMGWGITDPITYQFADTLRHVDLNYVPQQQCESKFTAFEVGIDDTMICALKGQGKDTCAGDSGGPLVMYGPGQGAEEHLLVGVVSFGSPQGCGHKSMPGVYSSVASARTFIDYVIQAIS